jgi:hypothetical protein
MIEKKVEVNGALTDGKFSQDNVREAKSTTWERMTAGHLTEHKHCIVCAIALSHSDRGVVYRSGRHYLCSFCKEHFVG